MTEVLQALPMSVKEARKILGVAYKSYNNDAIVNLLYKLDKFALLIMKHEKVLNTIDMSDIIIEEGSNE
jgi:hypothetical protein